MSWVLLAIVSHVFWGLTNIGEKFLVDKHFKNPHVYLLVGFFAGGLSILILPFIDFIWPSINQFFYLLLASLGFFVGAMFYLKAIKIEEVSRINVLWNFIPIYTFFGAWLFIGEKLTIQEILALLILVIGGFIASLHAESFGRFKLSKAFFLMLVACAFFGTYGVALRLVMTQGYPFSCAFVWNAGLLVVYSLVVLLFNKNLRRDLYKERHHFLLPQVILIIIIVNIISRIGTLFNTWAISLGPISLVNAMEGSQALFVFLATVLMTIFIPKIIKEEIDKKNIILKLVALVFMVVGVVVLNLG